MSDTRAVLLGKRFNKNDCRGEICNKKRSTHAQAEGPGVGVLTEGRAEM
jgi:hypothetical protein